jgi:UDP-galactopyranose mutase
MQSIGVTPKKVVVVGAGLSGLTAGRILADSGSDVHVFDTRNHIGGNCSDKFVSGCMFHKYGAHIFHTNDDEVNGFVKRFTSLNGYRHKVMAETEFGLIQIPFRDVSETISYGMIKQVTEGYSKKQWGIDYSDLPSEIKSRLTMRSSGESLEYFTDKWQGIPRNGYSEMFESMSEGMTIHLGVSKDAWRAEKADLVVYTAKIDEYFNYCHGRLGYRSLSFATMVTFEQLPCAVVNNCRESSPETRSIDHGYWNGRTDSSMTLVTTETPCEHTEDNIPYYPMPFGDNVELKDKYLSMAKDQKNVMFLGRLGRYQYINMDQAIAKAMAALNVRFGSKEK